MMADNNYGTTSFSWFARVTQFSQRDWRTKKVVVVCMLVPIRKSFIHVWRLPTHVRASFCKQLLFFMFCLCNTKIIVIPIRKIDHTCMVRDCVATIIHTDIFFLLIRVLGLSIWVWSPCARHFFLHSFMSGCYENFVRVWVHIAVTIVRVWSVLEWPDRYGHSVRLCSYVSGHFLKLTGHVRSVVRSFLYVSCHFSADRIRTVTGCDCFCACR